MAYVKNTWADGDIITAEKMNHLEDGVADGGGGGILVIESQYDDGIYTLPLTFREIYEAFGNGIFVVVKKVANEEGNFPDIQVEHLHQIYVWEGVYYISGNLQYQCNTPDDYPHTGGIN